LLFIFSEATGGGKWYRGLTFGEPFVTARMQFVFLSPWRGKKRGPWCPGAAISFPAVTFLTGCLQDNEGAAWATGSSSWQTACAAHRGHTDCLSLVLTQYAGAGKKSWHRKGYERSEESLWAQGAWGSLSLSKCVRVFCICVYFGFLSNFMVYIRWVFSQKLTEFLRNQTSPRFPGWSSRLETLRSFPLCHLSVFSGVCKQTSISGARRLLNVWLLLFISNDICQCCVSSPFSPIFIKDNIRSVSASICHHEAWSCIPLMCDHYTNEVNGSAVLTIRWMPPSGTCPLLYMCVCVSCASVSVSVCVCVFAFRGYVYTTEERVERKVWILFPTKRGLCISWCALPALVAGASLSVV